MALPRSSAPAPVAADVIRRLFEEGPIGMALVDPAYRFVHVNQALCRLVGYPRRRLLGMTFLDITPPEDRDVSAEQARRLFAGEVSSYRLEKRYRTADGRIVWVNLYASLVPASGDGPPYALGLTEDITARKQAEERLRAALVRQQEALARLRDLEARRSELLAGLSHDLRSPLAAITGLVGTLTQHRSRLPAQVQDEILARVAAQAARLDRMMTDLLELERLSQAGVLRPGPLDLGELVARIVAAADLQGRQVEVHAPPAPIEGDAQALERVVDNLLSNALRHTPAHARIWVTVTPEADHVDLVVADEGPGVPDAQKEAVFRLFRGEPGTSGVGLAVVRRLAELHGGRAWVEDRPGGGARFVVRLSRTRAPAAGAAPVLDESAERLRLLLQAAPDAVVIVDQAGRIVSANRQTEELFGYSGLELAGRPIEDLIPERFRDAHRAHRAGYAADPRPRPMGAGLELFARRRDGSEFPVDIALSPVRTPEGPAVAAFIRDITERRRAEEATRALREAAHRRRQALEINDRVVQGIAGALYALQLGKGAEAVRTLQTTIRSAREMMSGLLTDEQRTQTGGALVRDEPAVLGEAPPAIPPPEAGARLRVLVADDTPDLRYLVRISLEAAGIAVVGEAADGAEAVRLAEDLQPDVVLLDLAMPVMDGLEAIPRIRRCSPRSKIVVLSGYAARDLAARALGAGADHYLEKGGALGDLTRVLREVCETPRPTPALS